MSPALLWDSFGFDMFTVVICPETDWLFSRVIIPFNPTLLSTPALEGCFSFGKGACSEDNVGNECHICLVLDASSAIPRHGNL